MKVLPLICILLLVAIDVTHPVPRICSWKEVILAHWNITRGIPALLYLDFLKVLTETFLLCFM